MCWLNPLSFLLFQCEASTATRAVVDWLNIYSNIRDFRSRTFIQFDFGSWKYCPMQKGKSVVYKHIWAVDKYSNGFVHVRFCFLLTSSMDTFIMLWIYNDAHEIGRSAIHSMFDQNVNSSNGSHSIGSPWWGIQFFDNAMHKKVKFMSRI